MKVTLKDLAAASGFSSATISRVLNGNPNISEETRDQVLQAIQDFGYVLPAAKERRKRALFMIIVDDILNPFLMEITQALAMKLDERQQQSAIFCSFEHVGREAELVRDAAKNGFRGVFLITARESPLLADAVNACSIPVVFVNRVLKQVNRDWVCVDNFAGGYKATSYLIEMGHRRILCLTGPQDYSTAQDRAAGFRAAMIEHGLPVNDEDIVCGSIKAKRGYEQGQAMARNFGQHTAVFAMNDIIAAALISSLQEEGYQVPADLSVVCFDDTYLATSGKVKLTTMGKDTRVIGESAAETMFFRLDHPDAPVRRTIFETNLIVRDSVRKLEPVNGPRSAGDAGAPQVK